MEQRVLKAREEKDSIGGAVELVVHGCPAGLGDPIFGKLDARLAQALFSLGAVKGVEIGLGFRAAGMRGSEFNDPMRDGRFVTNNAGGILGGISNGAGIIARLAVKPTPSIAQPQQTVDKQGKNVDVTIEGRHDPCIVPRIVPVVESMAALVLLDAWELQRRLRPDADLE
jgi:chorismate synthase